MEKGDIIKMRNAKREMRSAKCEAQNAPSPTEEGLYKIKGETKNG